MYYITSQGRKRKTLWTDFKVKSDIWDYETTLSKVAELSSWIKNGVQLNPENSKMFNLNFRELSKSN